MSGVCWTGEGDITFYSKGLMLCHIIAGVLAKQADPVVSKFTLGECCMV
jgi:hypothetical protein